MFGKKTLLEDWRGQPSNGVFFMFWILDGSSKSWCFEWNGILSIPQVWRRLSPHEERITHVSSSKIFTKKATNWNGINSQPNGVNFQPTGVNYFGCFQCILGLWHATYLPMFPRVCEYQKSAQNARMAADPARIKPNSWNQSFWLRRQKLLKRQYFCSLG